MCRTYQEGDDPFMLSGFLQTSQMQLRSWRVVLRGHTPLKPVSGENFSKSEQKDKDYFF